MCGIFFHYGKISNNKKSRFKKNFLKLPPDLKGKIYKALIVNILKKIKFPYNLKKVGFIGYKSKRKI